MIQIDEIGLLFEAPLVDANGAILAQPPALPGWHANATHTVPGWDALRTTASTPRRVFGGVDTVFYRFADQAAFQAALAAADLALPESVHVPSSISMAQARLALLSANLFDAVDAAVQGMPRAAQIDWQYRQTVERDSPLVEALAQLLQLDAAAVDALFVLGATL